MKDGSSSARGVVGAALTICRRRAGTLALVGAVLFAPLALFEAAAGALIHEELGRDGERTLAIGLWLGVSLLMFGSALCAGLLDNLVGQEFGHQDTTLRQALRSLPYRRLIGVDVAQAVIVGIGSLLGLVPGLIVFTLTCLAGSLVMIESCRTRTALSRSASLTSRRFALTFVVVTIPVAIEHQLLHALEAWIGFPFVVLWALHTVSAIVVLVPVVVGEVTLAYRLVGDTLTRTAAEPARP